MGLLTIVALLVSLAAIDNSVRGDKSVVSNFLNQYEIRKQDGKNYNERGA